MSRVYKLTNSKAYSELSGYDAIQTIEPNATIKRAKEIVESLIKEITE
jgi:hypothetical protein